MTTSKATFHGALALLLLTAALPARQREPAQTEIRITGYEIFEQEFEKPLVRLDERGVRRSYSRAFVVHLRGNFGEPRATAVDIFIGDYRVPEYGGTRDGLYFRIYDEKLLTSLEARPFAYGFAGQKVRTVDLRFSPASRKPFKKVTRFPA